MYSTHLTEDEEEECRATAAEEGALGTTKALQPAAERAMQAINPSFMARRREGVVACVRMSVRPGLGAPYIAFLVLSATSLGGGIVSWVLLWVCVECR